MKDSGVAVAYPGLPLIFAEGFSDYKKRISGHSHASFALTDLQDMVRTETRAQLIPAGVEIQVEGVEEANPRMQSAHSVVREMLGLAAGKTGISLMSKNQNILTGSSDSGAAALVASVDDTLELGLPYHKLEEYARKISETAYRSIYGGLSEYTVDDRGNISTNQLKKASYFKDVVIYAVPFELKRFSADDLHLRVSQHPRYNQRNDQVNVRLSELKETLGSGDIVSILRLMELDAKTVHQMFADMGMTVIREGMKDFTVKIDDLRAT
ncbi:MAG: hypothetical protein KKD39_04970, partial [Candidatus Altiarchaeota archaeon]|nr:hypothetical protein [Candidatus Altiarchaeota archaeon]